VCNINLSRFISFSKGDQKVLDTKNAFKKWLKKEIGLMEGTTKNWCKINKYSFEI